MSKYQITNNPKYEEQERARLKAEHDEMVRRNIEEQAWHDSFINNCLDAIQRAIDYKKYSVTYERRHLFILKKRVTIILGYEFRYDSDNRKHSKFPLMNEIANIIQSKYPQWEVRGFHNDNPDEKSSDDGRYGVIIWCDKDEL